MSYTKEQQENLINSYFEGKSLYCPNDGQALQANYNAMGNSDYQLFISCRTCNEKYIFCRENDPMLDNFDNWTPEERKQIRSDVKLNYATCPNDNTSLEIEGIQVWCKRCRNRELTVG